MYNYIEKQTVADILGKIRGAIDEKADKTSAMTGLKVNGALLSLADNVANLLVAEGTQNGTIKVNSVDIAVKGLASLAYKAEISYADLAQTLKDIIDAKAEQADIDTLTGEGEGSISKMIDSKINDFATKVSEDGTVNTIKELIDWVAEHGAEASEMVSDIEANATSIADLKALVGELPETATATTVVGYIAEAINALGMGNYYTKAEVDADFVKKSDMEAITADDIYAMFDGTYEAE